MVSATRCADGSFATFLRAVLTCSAVKSFMAKKNIAADTLLCTRIYRPTENLYHRGFAQVDVRLMMKLTIVLDEGGGANLLKDNESQDVKEQHR